MSKTLREVLNTTLSPDNVSKMLPSELAEYLVVNEIVKTPADVNKLIVEGIQRAYREDDEFPIHYYSKDEPMSENGKNVTAPPSLTDDYIKTNMS